MIYFILLILSCLCAQTLRADTGLYTFPKIEEQKISVPADRRRLDPFMTALSKKTAVPEQTLAEEFRRGAGRGEMIRIILIAKKSGQPINAIVREREKGAWFSKIAQTYQLDNRALRKESLGILKEIEAELKAEEAKNRAEADVRPSTKTAGVSDSTGSELPGSERSGSKLSDTEISAPGGSKTPAGKTAP